MGINIEATKIVIIGTIKNTDTKILLKRVFNLKHFSIAKYINTETDIGIISTI